MGLIDKDELRETFDGTDWYHLHNGKMVQGANSALHIPYFRAEDVYKVIYSAPTIEPPTTTWLGDFSPYTCEKCGYHVDSKTRYCPECGRRATNYE